MGRDPPGYLWPTQVAVALQYPPWNQARHDLMTSQQPPLLALGRRAATRGLGHARPVAGPKIYVLAWGPQPCVPRNAHVRLAGGAWRCWLGLSATTVRGQVVGPVIGGQRRFDKPGTAPAGAASNPHMVRWRAQYAACCGGPQSARRAAGNAAKRNNSGQNGRLGRLQGALCGWGGHHIQEARLNRPRDRPRLAAGAGGGVWGAVYPHRRAGSGPAAERKGPVQEPLTGQETHLPNRSAGPLGCATQGTP